MTRNEIALVYQSKQHTANHSDPFAKLEFVTCIVINENNDVLTNLEFIVRACVTDFVHLNYPLSVGDVVIIDSKGYRCTETDWEEISLSEKELTVLEEVYEEFETINETDMEEEEMETTKTAQHM